MPWQSRSKLIFHVTVKPRCERGLENVQECRPVKTVQPDFWFLSHPDPVGVLLLNCSVLCSRAQSSISLWLVCPFCKCIGSNGVVERDDGSFLWFNTFWKYSSWLFPSRATQFQQPLSLIWRNSKWGLVLFQSEPYLRSLLFCCVLIFQVGDFSFCLLVLLLRTCQKFWDRSDPLCVRGLGFVLDAVFVFGVVWVELCSLAPTASWWWAAPRWPSCCATWWCVSSKPKTSVPDARLGYRLTWHLSKTALWFYSIICVINFQRWKYYLHFLCK